MRKIYFYSLILLTFAAINSCTYTFPEVAEPSSGNADFTKVVAAGNSLTAGFMNGALYDAGQENSYANIIATQMQLSGGGVFNQPDINSVNGYFGTANNVILGRLHLVGLESPAPAPIIPGDAITSYSGDRAALNNFGVPGLRVATVNIQGYGGLNDYFGRFQSSANASVLEDATAANGSFIIFWLGSNDILGYAMAGATGTMAGTNSNDMTSTSTFSGEYDNAISTLFAGGKKGIIANIPNVQNIPFFTTVPWNAIPMDQATADQTNAAYVDFNNGIKLYNAGNLPGQTAPPPNEAKRDTIGFISGNNGIIITDEELPDLTAYGIPSIRMATSTDLITLPAGAVIGTLADPNDPTSVIGVGRPLDEVYTLTIKNQSDISDRIAAFNAIIAAHASNNIALLDVNSMLDVLFYKGVTINGTGMDATIFPPFGAFSLDGIHPNARGYAYIASLFIDKINEQFGSTVPNVNPNNYPGNALPVPQ